VKVTTIAEEAGSHIEAVKSSRTVALWIAIIRAVTANTRSANPAS
jgi:hypothetical protein